MAGTRLLACAIATFAAISAAGAPVSPQAPAGIRGDIEVWAWNIAAGGLRAVLPDFEARNPYINVHVNMSGINMQARFLLSLTAGVGAPDLCQLQVREIPRYAITGKLTDLTDVAQEYAGEFAPSFWQDCVYDGRIYGLPWDMGPCGVFYKRHIFEKYGIDVDSIETWDDYIEAGKTILHKSGGKTKMICLPSGGISWDLLELLLTQNNCQVFDKEGRVAINSPQTAEVIDLFRKIIQAGIGAKIEYYTHEFMSSFVIDNVATYPLAVWFGGQVRDYAKGASGDWGVFRLPAFHPGGLRNSNIGGSVLVIPTQSENKEAAWAFMEFSMCSPKSQLTQFREFDLFPALLSTHNDPFFDEHVEFYGGQQIRRLFALDIDKIPPMTRTTDWMEALRYISQAMSSWANGDLEPSEVFLARIEERLSRRLDREISPESLTRAGARP